MIRPAVLYWCAKDDQLDNLSLNEVCRSIKKCHKLSQGLDQLSIHHFDVLLVSDVFAYEEVLLFLKRLKSKYKNIPVVVVREDYSSRDELLKLGASDCFAKHLFSAGFLDHVLNSAIERAEISRQKQDSIVHLKRLENRIGTIVRNTPVILFMLDTAGVFKVGLGKLWDQFKVNKQFVLGQKLVEIYHEYPAIIDAYNQALKGSVQSLSVNINDIVFEIILTPVLSSNQKVKEILGLAHDVTQRVHSEMSLIKAKKLAENTAKLKQEFIANMSHEIRTPMNAIVGFTNLLEETKMNGLQGGYVHAVKVSSESLLGLIDDILDFSKIESGDQTLSKSSFNVHGLVNSIDKVLSLKVREKKIAFRREIAKEVPLELIGDSNKLHQVLTNLLANSVKFTKKGEVLLKVDLLNLHNRDALISFQVTDTGIGIPDHMVKKIFDSFVQVNSESNRKYGGAGLGLSIVKKIVRQLNGTIKMDSTLNRGSTFTVSVPFKIAKNFVGQKSRHSKLDLRLPNGLKILLAEDNLMNQKLVLMILNDFDVAVDLAENGVEAVKAIRQNDYDLVLMDIQMPEMDGIEATRIIRTELTWDKKDIPIIAMTAHAFQQEIDKCRLVGMNDCVLKPINKEKFINTMNSCMSEYDKKSKKGGQNHLLQEVNDGGLIAIKKEDGEKQADLSLNDNFDLSYLRSLLNEDQKMIEEIIATFQEEVPVILAELTSSIQAQDFFKIAKTAHKAKASFNVFGMEKVVKALLEIELACKRNDLSKLTELSHMIHEEYSAVSQTLKRQNGKN